MGLSRLDNFLKSSRGTILYVNPNDLDATDSIENQGNSLTRPFKTIQRALIEASRFSYQRGLNNDRFGKTTILLYPGDHIVDNRPGYIPDGVNLYRTRSGAIVNDLPPYDLTSNLSLDSPENELFKLNSIHGGVIVPRGTSIVGLDLRKTKVRPKYVPDPENDNIERSALFRITGACYFWQFTMFDSDPNGVCYKDYTKNQFVPNFSHHKLTCFEYADGTNNVEISDTFQSFSTDRTDLDMYYEKISLVYGQSSGRAISPDYPSSGLDIQAKIDEHRIVGSTGVQVGITSIKAGDGATSSTTITVTTATEVPGLDVDTPFRISGITASGYTGQFVVSDKVDSTNIKYQVQNEPTNPLPSITGSSLQLQSDTVTSASPYIFNLSLRSVFGMCGMHADGSKATGFKSMVVAQFTGIGLQKDDNAFVKYNATTGNYEDNTVAGNEILSTDSRAVYKPSYKNFHIKCSNNSVIQAVSIFAIGYAEHFVSETGGDQSITNSNSNFGAKALIADGFRKDAFSQDDVGYFTHFIPPKEIPLTETSIEFDAIDVLKTGRVPNTGIGSTGNLYLFDRTNKDAPPENVIDGFRVGAKTNDTLKVLVSSAGSVTEYGARIVMPNSQSSSEKIFLVNRSATGINSIGVFSSGGATNVITLTANHTFLTGETVRVISDTGQIPDGLESNQIYHAIVSGLDADNLKLAKTFNDAVNGNAITINEKGGILKVSSRVTDKNAGEVGHPIQYDDTNNQWYVNVSTAATDNTLFPIVVGFGSTGFGDATPRSFITRRNDNRNANDTLYRARYVIPASSGGSIARPPVEGFVIQESNTSIGSSTAEIQTYFGSGSIANINQQRNFRFIAGATFSAGAKTASFTTELPHDLTVGSLVQINNIKSANNTTGAGNSGFNYTANVTGISSSKHFTVGLGTDPGLFTSDTTTRNTSLPNFKKKEYDDTLYVYRVEEAQKYVSGEQDGVYYLTVVTANEKPSVAPFTNEKYSQPVKSLFPQTQRDDPEADPQESRSFARSALIGDVVVNDPRKSLTKEAANRYFKANDIGIGITEIVSTNGLTHNVTSTLDHGLNRIVTLGITNAGAGYGAANTTLYNATLAPTVGAAETVVGKHATAKITTGSSGEITAVTVMDGGSAYGIGNSMFVTGVSTFTGFSSAIVTVTGIYNNVGDTLRITGVNSEGFASYNQLYRITEVPVGGATSITVAAASTVGGFTTTGIGATAATGAFAQLTGESVAIDVSSFAYNKDVGIATLTTSGQKHVFATGQRITLQGATSNLYNGSFVVSKVNSLTQFELKVGISTNTPSLAVDAPDFGAFRAFHEGLSANDGVITNDSENLNGRMIPTYAGITTTLSAAMINATTEEMNIVEITKLDFRIGDYLLVDDELVRIKDQVSGNPLRVFRGVLGTRPTSHVIDSVVRRVLINPVELRRHSINRASGHTFEYVGYGPGNYSTALPDRQDRTIGADEELLAQSLKRQGGINFYTGMNDRGISYSGNKKLSTITGREEIFDTPFQTIEGEDISTLPSLNVVTPVEGRFARSVNVEGGADNKVSSSFNGPVIINNKLTVNSPLETNSIFIQGDATVSRKHTVGIATPILAGNPGDLVYSANPSEGDYVGWIYSTQNEWRRFGATSLFTDQNIMIFDKVGIGTTTPGEATFKVGAGSTQLVVDGDGVGIGTTANGFDLRVQGNTNISGNINAGIITGTFLHGNGAAITNVNVSAAGWTNSAGVLYNTALGSVGIGTSASAVNLTVGDRHENTGAGQSTSLFVFGNAIVAGLVTCRDFIPVGVITATSFDFDSGIDNAGRIRAGIATLGVLHVGAGGTIITTTNAVGLGSVGINSTVPSADLDVNGRVFFKTYSERVGNASLAAQVATVDLSEAQTFICTATSNITHFTLKNAPSGSTSFTIKVEQDSTGSRSIDIDDFRTVGGVAIPVFWPGGVVPTPTTTASRTDIYSFKIFNGDNPTSSGLYGVVGGQNFQN